MGPTVERIILTTSDTKQIIKEETSTILPRDQLMSYEDLIPGASITRDTQGNYVLKEVEYKTIKFPCSAEEEDVEEDRVSRRRRRPGRGSESGGERESGHGREFEPGQGAPVHSRLGSK